MQDDSDPQLDAEYRAFIRSLHKDTIDTIIAAEKWWDDCFRIVSLGGDAAKEADSEDSAEAIEADWRQTVRLRILTLINGHPDPDVRFAADILVKRLWSVVLILTRLRRESDRRREEEDTVAIHLVHDGFERLRRAAYHAPFRITRPSPTYDGVPIGNSEPLPGKMLETIKELQAAGVLEPDSGIFSRAIPKAVRQLSDILFMPSDERAAVFERSAVQDPTVEPAQPGDDVVKFGFSL